MNLKEKRAAKLAAANAIIDGAKADGRELTTDEATAVQIMVDEIGVLDEHIVKANEAAKVLGQLDDMADEQAEASGTGSKRRKGYLNTSAKSFAGLASKAARGMVTDPDYGKAYGLKALLPAGQTAVSVTMAATPVSDTRPLSELLAALPVVRQSAPIFRYLRQTARTNRAGVVAPGAAKPTSEYGLTPVEGELQVLAHISEAIDKYALADVGNLERFIQEELLYGLHLALEHQLLNGTGTGQLTGLLNTSGIQTQAFATDLITTTRKAVTAVESIGHRAGLFILNPADWESLELARTDTAGGLELGGPVDRAKRTLWGVPIAICTALPAKTGLLLDPSTVAVDTDGQIEVLWSDSVGDDFSKNQLRARCESRYHVSVYQPLGVVKMTTASGA